MKSLRDIEKTVTRIWLNQDARDWLSAGSGAPPPDCLKDADPAILEQIDQKGSNLYATLMRAGHHDVMESIYPYCSKLFKDQFESIINDYLTKFPSDHYNFNRLCSRFSEYLTTYGGTWLERYPYIAELADYEWLELEKIEQAVRINIS